MIVRLARQDGRDAVFDVPAQLIRSMPADPEIEVSLTEEPSIRAVGRVREVAAEADPSTRTFEVKVGLAAAAAGDAARRHRHRPDGDRRGRRHPLPASAHDPAGRRAGGLGGRPRDRDGGLRAIDVLRFEPAYVVVASGVEPGDIVVTAGVQALHPGQKVRLLGARA